MSGEKLLRAGKSGCRKMVQAWALGRGLREALWRPGRRGRGSEAESVVGPGRCEGKAPAAEDERRPGKGPKAKAGSGGVVEGKASRLRARAEGRGLGRGMDALFRRGQRLPRAERDSC